MAKLWMVWNTGNDCTKLALHVKNVCSDKDGQKGRYFMKKRTLTGIVAAVLITVGICGGCNTGVASKEDAGSSGQDTATVEKSDSNEENTAVQNGITPEDTVILFTTDIHNKLTEYIGYAGVAAYKKEVEAVCGADRVALADCGDSLDGSDLGEDTRGGAIIDIMNEVGYDVAVPGNHDFKYSVAQLKQLAQDADFCYLSCNLRELATVSPVLEPYTIVEKGGKRLAFIGVTTAESTFSKEEYQDFAMEREDGSIGENPLYDFTQDDLYGQVQRTIDEAQGQDVDYVILLTHLGYDSSEYSSTELIAQTTGVDAVIDGHAHTEIPMEELRNANGETVIQTSAGEYLCNIGQLVIDADGKMTSKLLHVSEYTKKDDNITKYIENLKNAR